MSIPSGMDMIQIWGDISGFWYLVDICIYIEPWMFSSASLLGNEELIKQLTEKMSRPSPELISLRGELERTRDQLHQERAMAKQKEEHWKVKVQEEVKS